MKIITGVIELTDEEVAFASSVAATKHRDAIKDGYKDQHGLEARGLGEDQEHVLGCLGSRACAKKWGVHWPPGINNYREIPELEGFDIITRSQLHFQCIVRKDAPGDRPVVLVHCVRFPNKFNVTGWILASEAQKREAWLKGHGGREPAYFPPNYELNDWTPYIVSAEEDEREEREAMIRDMERQEADDERRWEGIELAPPAKAETIKEGPYAGFKMAVEDHSPDPARAKKCADERKEYVKERDPWIERIVGPIHSKKKSKAKRERLDAAREQGGTKTP